jgi:hypothetical protein
MSVGRCALKVLDESGLKKKVRNINGKGYQFVSALKRKDTATELRDSLKKIGLSPRYRKDPNSGLYVVMVENGNSTNGNSREGKANVKVKSKRGIKNMSMNVKNKASKQDSGVVSVSNGIPKLGILTSDNCPGCRQVENEKDIADAIKAGRIDLIDVETKAGRQIADRLGARYVPTFVISNSREICILDEKGQKTTRCVSKSKSKIENGNNAKSSDTNASTSKKSLKIKKR